MSTERTSQSPEGLLTLLQIRGVGPRIATDLACHFHNLSDIEHADEYPPCVTSRVRKVLAERLTWTDAHEKAHRQLDAAEQSNVQLLSYYDEGFPPLLRHIPDPPAVLYVKGTLGNNLRSVACVGTRNPSHFGLEVSRRITKMLVENEYSIVSGLALGIDAESHSAALEHGGHTVAILANGLDSVYPAKNRDLAAQILDQGGALISEQPVGAKAFATNLVQRDRLQSGMSLATFVMQTDVVGGTMHTVRFTLEQDRVLFVPVPTEQYRDDPPSRGIRALAEQTGQELADTLQAKGPYRDRLVQFSDSPVATPINGLDDYPHVLGRLQSALEHWGTVQEQSDSIGQSMLFE